ncbi:MAG: SurA N-terminal domain-containing protein [Paludibacteraceae bacterium]|nr:SurA N-terminal domain-containing protein [Paludibacteraceae bacterium]
MTTLQRIRNHGVILLVVVGVAMLAFILGDFLNSGSSFFNRSRENVGVIAGHKVHYTEYEAAKDQLTEVYKIESGSNDINEDVTIQLRNQVWQMLLMDYTLREQAEKIGMDVTAEELSNLCIGANPHQLIRQRRAFYDETGSFNRSALINFLNSLAQEVETPEQAANLQQAKNYWLYWENAVRLTHLQEKYTGLLGKMLTANNLDAKYAFDARQTSVNVSYVERPYFAVADSLVKVTDADIKKLYAAQKELYKRTPNRSIVYVSFPIVPSEQDYAEVEKLMKSLESDFQTKEDVAAIVNSNSDILYDGRDYSETTIPAEYKDFAFGKGAKKGQYTELTFTDGTYAMARIMDCGYNQSDSVQLILVANGEGTEDVELGWYQASDLQKTIADPAFAGKKGTQFTVSTGMGEQTFKIADKSKPTPKVKLAILSRKVTPSSKTYGALYNEAKQFIVSNNSVELLRQSAQEQGLSVTPAFSLVENADKVNDLKNSRTIVRWAYEAKEGQLSDVFECGEQFVVAALTEINEGNYRTIDEVRAELQMQAVADKKAAYIINQLQGVSTLEEAAQLLDADIQEAENITLASSRLGGAGIEPAVIGAALALENNATSAPIKGNAGVYMVRIGEKQVAAGELNAAQEISNLNMRTAYSAPYQAISLIEEKAQVEDNRARFQ